MSLWDVGNALIQLRELGDNILELRAWQDGEWSEWQLMEVADEHS